MAFSHPLINGRINATPVQKEITNEHEVLV